MADLFVVHNNDFLPAENPVLHLNNRSFVYGDGLFESIRVMGGKALWLEHHYQRLEEGMGVLGIEAPSFMTKEWFVKKVAELLSKNGINKGGKVRVTVFRNHGGSYWPKNNEGSITIEANSFSPEKFELNEEGIVLEIYPDMKKQNNELAKYKTTNALLYVMASRYCQKKGLGDCLLMNESNSIIEATSSNIFIVSNKVLYTPSLEDGCVAGTMRMQIINMALDNDMKVYEYTLTPQNLLVADEVFLTNAIHGIQWISSYRVKRYFNDVSTSLVGLLNERAANLG